MLLYTCVCRPHGNAPALSKQYLRTSRSLVDYDDDDDEDDDDNNNDDDEPAYLSLTGRL